jgi:hypothetical protein
MRDSRVVGLRPRRAAAPCAPRDPPARVVQHLLDVCPLDGRQVRPEGGLTGAGVAWVAWGQNVLESIPQQ